MSTDVGVVILTMGKRPVDLRRAIDSVLAQRDVNVDVVVVGNGWQPTDLPDTVASLYLPENMGIPTGRNAGVPLVSGELLFFLDDDAAVPDPNFLASIKGRFDSDPHLGLIQPRVEDATGIEPPGRWVPRLVVGDRTRPGPATTLWEGATAVRREALEAADGWPDEFFYGHEGIDLVWRVWDAGYTCWYAADLVVHHPVINPLRHEEFYRMNARNRVWLAKRNLPVVLEPVYVGSWIALTVARVRDKNALRAWFAGLREGIESDPGNRRPMTWRTVWALSKAGRPPVI
ncbi:MAG: glycosyltransferase family 2 protein [Candidatus Nanopelagicales bacterium]